MKETQPKTRLESTPQRPRNSCCWGQAQAWFGIGALYDFAIEGTIVGHSDGTTNKGTPPESQAEEIARFSG
jgi:hypothetical protein